MSDYLPEEVLVEILSRLPVKSLLKSRCVCKSWNSLITSSNFITKHLTHSTMSNKNNPNPLILLRHCSKKTEKQHYSLRYDNKTLSQFMELESSFESHRRGEYLRVVGSCNGLICLSDDLEWSGYTIIFWNPLIGKSVTLPKPNFTFTFSTHGHFYPILGFGYDSRVDDYKLVRLVYLEGLDVDYVGSVELYSLSTGTWKTISAAAPNCNVCERWYTNAFSNGAAHWIAYCRTDDDLYCIVLAFDMCDEVFHEMMLPKSLLSRRPLNMSISEFGESISVIEYDNFQHERCDIWVMKEYNVVESWIKQYTINLKSIYADVVYYFYFHTGSKNVLGFRKDGEVLLEMNRGQLYLFNPESNRVADIGIQGDHGYSCIKSYVESLVLLDKPN